MPNGVPVVTKDLEDLYSAIKEYTPFTEKSICETCPSLCSRDQKWHWLLPDEAERLKDKMLVEEKYGAFFFEGGQCPLIEGAHCSIYDSRPLECRLSPVSLYYMDKELFWIIDTGCPYLEKYENDKEFWNKVDGFISKIELYITEKMEKEFMDISEAIRNFDPLTEDEDFIKMRAYSQRR